MRMDIDEFSLIPNEISFTSCFESKGIQNRGKSMYEHVDWLDDIRPLEHLMRAEYEKCNIWPGFEDECEFTDVLKEEVKEANKNMAEVTLWMDALARTDNDKPELKKIAIIRGYAIKTILECLHVISVVNKQEQMRKIHDE